MEPKEIQVLIAERDFYKARCDLLQQALKSMRDPERAIVCDILANGALLPKNSADRDWALDALHLLGDCGYDPNVW